MASGLISLGLGVAGAATKAFGGRKRPNIRRSIAELRAQRPTGYLTPEDYRAAEQTRGRLVEQANTTAGQQGAEARRRANARGLVATPDLARIDENTSLMRQGAGDSAEEQLYNTQRGREAYQHTADLAIFNAQVGDAAREQNRQDAENSGFWNSMTEFFPVINDAINGTGNGADANWGDLGNGQVGYKKWSGGQGRMVDPGFDPSAQGIL